MKVGPVHIIGAAAAAVGLAFLISEDEEGAETTSGGLPDRADTSAPPRVGFQLSEILLPQRPEVDLERWESEQPTIGTFFQIPRGHILLGAGRKSVTWTALYRAANWCLLARNVPEDEAHKRAEKIAHNGDMRSEYGNLILASSWNDGFYGTWGCNRRSPVGPHGRGIPFEACHADNRSRMLAGRAPARQIPMGVPGDRGTGSAVASTGRSRPYLWLPMINIDAFLQGEITTRGVIWPGEQRISGLEPPPEFWAFGAGGPE